MQEQGWAAPQPATRSLRLLLLICAGALIVIFVTLVSMVQESRSVHVTPPAGQYCGMSIVDYDALPVTMQHWLHSKCAATPEHEVR